MNKTLQAVRARTLALLQPAERLPLDQWLEQNIYLPSDLTHLPGKFVLWSFQRELANAMIDPAIERISILKGARLGYTSLLIGALAWYIRNDPTAILCVVPTDDDVRNLVVGPLESIFNASPSLKGVLPDPHTGSKARDTLKFRRGPGWNLRVVSARAPRNLRAHAARIVVLDEVDAFEVTSEGEVVSLAEKRSLTFANRKLICGSTPTDDNSYIAAAFERGDQRIYECKCQHCGAFHELRWADIQWPKGRPSEAGWACPSCGSAHTDADKPAMVEQGRWRALAPLVRGHASFRLSCLIAPFEPASWGRLAEEFTAVSKRPEQLRVFANTVLAEKWRADADDGPMPHELQALSEPISLDRIPPETLYMTSGVDIQGDRIEVSTLGFTEDDEWLVLDHRQLYGDPAKEDIWSDLADALAERFPHPLGGQIGRDASCIDCGDGNVQGRVLAFCAGHRDLRLIPIKGAAGSRPALTPTASKRTRSLQIAGVDPIKTRIADRLAKRTGIRFSDALPLAYYEQLTSERAVVRYSRGQPVRLFERYPGRIAEALDCLVYSLAAKAAVAVNPARRTAELSSKVALRPVMPTTIRSAWLDSR